MPNENSQPESTEKKKREVEQLESPILVQQTQSAFHPHAQRCSHDAVIRVFDEAGNVIETYEHVGEFKEP
jgi:hypothetical protein